jgi:hypothetical protein
MALGWVAMLAMLGFWAGTVNDPASHVFPEKGQPSIRLDGQLEQRAQQALILGRSV